MKIEDSQRIGICEAGEISYNLDVFDRLYDGNIIITKRLTDGLIEKLIENADKCILHFTVTGFGCTKIEPFTPSVEQSVKKFARLIECGFPISQTVLRIDPIVPTDKGIDTALNVLRAFRAFKIPRVRVSFLDMYKHVQERFKGQNIPIPNAYIDAYGNTMFHAPLKERLKYLETIKYCAEECGYEAVEVCGEPGIDSISCLSQKDIDILHLTDKITLIGNKGQRGSCSCPTNKTELIRNGKPKRCDNSCLYCFWK